MPLKDSITIRTELRNIQQQIIKFTDLIKGLHSAFPLSLEKIKGKHPVLYFYNTLQRFGGELKLLIGSFSESIISEIEESIQHKVEITHFEESLALLAFESKILEKQDPDHPEILFQKQMGDLTKYLTPYTELKDKKFIQKITKQCYEGLNTFIAGLDKKDELSEFESSCLEDSYLYLQMDSDSQSKCVAPISDSEIIGDDLITLIKTCMVVEELPVIISPNESSIISDNL